MKIDHIALYTDDLERARAFYERYFAATANDRYHNVKTGLQTYFLRFPGSDTRLELMTRPQLIPRAIFAGKTRHKCELQKL